MGKYFTKRDIEKISDEYYADLLRIMAYLEDNGNVSKDLTFSRLGTLWSDWSEDKYCASFMNPDEELMEEFADWLDRRW